MVKKKKAVKKKEDLIATALFFAGLFLGLGIGGAILGDYAAGGLIGLAVGFIASAIYLLITKKK